MVGLFGDLTLEEYEAIYNEVVQSQELQIGNQVRTNYVMETQLTKGFKVLEFSYNAFIIGFVLTVLIFLTTNLFLQV